LLADQVSWRRSHFIRYPAGSRRSAEGRLRPNYDVHGRDPQCPVNVDSGRPERANSSHSLAACERIEST
jgi:hypothetical protein